MLDNVVFVIGKRASWSLYGLEMILVLVILIFFIAYIYRFLFTAAPLHRGLRYINISK